MTTITFKVLNGDMYQIEMSSEHDVYNVYKNISLNENISLNIYLTILKKKIEEVYPQFPSCCQKLIKSEEDENMYYLYLYNESDFTIFISSDMYSHKIQWLTDQGNYSDINYTLYFWRKGDVFTDNDHIFEVGIIEYLEQRLSPTYKEYLLTPFLKEKIRVEWDRVKRKRDNYIVVQE